MQQTFIEILRSSADDRRALFSTVAGDLETRAENVEKDLYVCWVLDFLFNRRADGPISTSRAAPVSARRTDSSAASPKTSTS